MSERMEQRPTAEPNPFDPSITFDSTTAVAQGTQSTPGRSLQPELDATVEDNVEVVVAHPQQSLQPAEIPVEPVRYGFGSSDVPLLQSSAPVLPEPRGTAMHLGPAEQQAVPPRVPMQVPGRYSDPLQTMGPWSRTSD